MVAKNSIKMERVKVFTLRLFVIFLIFLFSLWIFVKGDLFNGKIIKCIDLKNNQTEISQGKQ